MSRTLQFVPKVTPIAVGLLLLYSGLHKAIYPGEVTLSLMALEMRSGPASAAVFFLTALELYLGTVLVFRVDLRFGLLAVTALMVAFCVFLFYLSMMAHPPSCGCLGLTSVFSSNRTNAVAGLGRNCLILWLLRVAYAHYFPRQLPPSERGNLLATT